MLIKRRRLSDLYVSEGREIEKEIQLLDSNNNEDLLLLLICLLLV
jgi:hypothetical protein